MPASHALHSHTQHRPAHEQHHRRGGPYLQLVAMTALHFAAMYVLMYAMVDGLGNVLNNVNQAYMAGLMAAAMVIIELAVMGAMYSSRRLNVALIATGVVALGACWVAIRGQAAVGDEQFLRSMIPHHAGAILMCDKAKIADPGIQDLCRRIIASQETEIAEMKQKLAELRGP